MENIGKNTDSKWRKKRKKQIKKKRTIAPAKWRKQLFSCNMTANCSNTMHEHIFSWFKWFSSPKLLRRFALLFATLQKRQQLRTKLCFIYSRMHFAVKIATFVSLFLPRYNKSDKNLKRVIKLKLLTRIANRKHCFCNI